MSSEPPPPKRARLEVEVGYEGTKPLPYCPNTVTSCKTYSRHHALGKARREESTKEILHEILLTDVGAAKAREITSEFLLTHTGIGEEIHNIRTRFQKFNIAKFHHILQHNWKEEDHYKKMKCEDLFTLLETYPSCTDKKAVEDEVFIQESDIVSSPKLEPLSHTTVFIFVNNICRALIPMSVWGSWHNYHVVENLIHSVISMGARDSITIGRVLDKMQYRDIRWLKELQHFERTYIASRFFVWLFDNILFQTIKCFLYPTKMSGGYNQIFFFRKEKIDSLFQKNVKHICEVLPPNSKAQGTLRLLPKKLGGVRPIYMGINKSASRQQYLHARLLLRYLSCREKDALASAPFFDVWCNLMMMFGKEKKLYFVKTDIRDAFGSVDTHQLKKLLHRAVKGVKTLKFMQYTSEHSGRKVHIPLVNGQPQYPPVRQGVVLKEDEAFEINVQSCLSTIMNSLHPIVNYGSMIVRSVDGLPQGGSLSSDLCNFYYSTMTSECLSDLTTQNAGVLLRAVDDFLYLSSSLENANAFQRRLMRGIPEYNCYINKAKTLSNTSYDVQRFYFNGYTVCLESRSIQCSLSVLTSIPIRYSVTFGNARMTIGAKLKRMISCRLPFHLVSKRHVDCETLLNNVWQLAITCGAKLHALLQHTCEVEGMHDSRQFANAAVYVARGILRKIQKIRGETLREDIFTFYFVYGVILTFEKLSCDSYKMTASRLRTICDRKLEGSGLLT